MSDEICPARVFRVKYAKAYSANGSGGDWKLYDDESEMKQDLLAAYLDVLGAPEKGRGMYKEDRWWFARIWRRHLRGDDETYPRVRSIHAVEQLVDGAWVDIQPEFIDPDVQLVGVR